MCERLNSELEDKSPQPRVCVQSYICVCMSSYIKRLTSDSRLNMPLFKHAYDDEALVTTVCVCVSVLSCYIKTSFSKWQPHDNPSPRFSALMKRKITFWHIRLWLVLVYGYTQLDKFPTVIMNITVVSQVFKKWSARRAVACCCRVNVVNMQVIEGCRAGVTLCHLAKL